MLKDRSPSPDLGGCGGSEEPGADAASASASVPSAAAPPAAGGSFAVTGRPTFGRTTTTNGAGSATTTVTGPNGQQKSVTGTVTKTPY